MLVTTQSAKRLLCFQETRGGPAHGHMRIPVVCDTSAHTADHGVRRFDHVGGGQTTRQFPSHAKPVDREQFLEPFEQTGRKRPDAEPSDAWRGL